MSFKSPAQRKFLFAMDKDKQKGIPVNKSSAKSFSVPKLPSVNMSPTVKPTNIPSLPALPKMDKFARVKKYFKKNF